jgi:hypothetical protein
MQEGIRFLNKMAGAYAPWFRGEDRFFQIGKMAFYSTFALLPKPWQQVELGSRNQDCPPFFLKRKIKVRTWGKEWGSLPSKNIGSFFAIVPPCMPQHPREILTNCRLFLKSQGRITIGIISPSSPWRDFFRRKMEAGSPDGERVRFYSLEEMENLLIEAGFTIQAHFSTLFQRPGQTITPEIPLKGYHPQAGFFVLIGEKPD